MVCWWRLEGIHFILAHTAIPGRTSGAMAVISEDETFICMVLQFATDETKSEVL